MANITRVSLGQPISGSYRKRPRSTWASSKRNGPVTTVRLHPLVLEAAQEIARPGERMVVISPTEVLLTHRQTRSATSDLR